MDKLEVAVLDATATSTPNDSSDSLIKKVMPIRNHKLNRLEKLFKKHSLEHPYRVSGPGIKFQYTGKEKKYESIVELLNSELKDYNLRADLFYDTGVIEISPKDGLSRELLGEYRSIHSDLFDPYPDSRKAEGQEITHSQTYCTQ